MIAQELPKNNIHKKGKILDLIAETEDGQIVNIELNNSDSKYLHRRNFAYICGLYSDSLKSSETYQNMPKFIQINLTNKREEIPLSTVYTVNSKETGIEFVDNFVIHEINLQKAKEVWYNNPNGKSLLALIDCNEEELENAIGDGYVERIKKEVKELNEDTKFVQFLSDEEEDRLYTNSIKQESYDEGIKEGIEQEKINIVKNMLKENIDINVISKVTGLSIDKLGELK